uniref:DUF4236 domain-containing protein n=1 Tax=Candidatus Kentrum sp. LFY TaxID=2126342 RepID=A0A450UZR4_9GAMM|nr:MAG: Protein of unknown function (DUF4236) [Candidatus Kentron sp. LFY]
MGMRFRKSVKIAPGVKINFSGSGASMTVGPRGASVNVSSRGTYLNAGIPGTGLSSRTRLSGAQNHQQFERERRRIEREQEKLAKERRRRDALASVALRLNDKGAIEATNSFGEPMSLADMRLLWEQKGPVVKNWLQEQCDEINGDIELLQEIHLDTPFPDSAPKYQPAPFDVQAPRKPEEPAEPPKPQLSEVQPLGYWSRLFKSRRIAHEEAVRTNEQNHQKLVSEWQRRKSAATEQYAIDLVRWEAETADWLKKKQNHEEHEAQKQQSFFSDIRGNTEVMCSSLEEIFSSMSWPRETIVAYQIEYGGQEVWLDVDLPEIEDLPQKVAALAANGRKLNIKNKPQKQLRQEYATHIHGISLRLAGTTMAALPRCDRVIISGYSQRLDTATGLVNDDYLFSVKYTRGGLAGLNFANLEQVDPVETMTRFEYIRKMTTTGVFKAIRPYSI